MKKVMLLGMGLFLASAITYAQVDTTGTPQQSTPQQSTPQVAPQQQESQNANDPSKNQIDSKHMIRIEASEAPKSLKRTLEAPEYEGWENATLYKDKRNNHYILQIQNGGKMRTHHFGSDGKPVGDY
jgi:hypothetical protein